MKRLFVTGCVCVALAFSACRGNNSSGNGNTEQVDSNGIKGENDTVGRLGKQSPHADTAKTDSSTDSHISGADTEDKSQH